MALVQIEMSEFDSIREQLATEKKNNESLKLDIVELKSTISKKEELYEDAVTNLKKDLEERSRVMIKTKTFKSSLSENSCINLVEKIIESILLNHDQVYLSRYGVRKSTPTELAEYIIDQLKDKFIKTEVNESIEFKNFTDVYDKVEEEAKSEMDSIRKILSEKRLELEKELSTLEEKYLEVHEKELKDKDRLIESLKDDIEKLKEDLAEANKSIAEKIESYDNEIIRLELSREELINSIPIKRKKIFGFI